jgi:signal transduction histidine kinase
VNAVRHSGARRVVVRSGTFEGEGGRRSIRIEVCDDGRGIEPAALERAGSRGLRHMRERAARLSGSLRVEPLDAASGGGTRVALTLPASENLDDAARRST